MSGDSAALQPSEATGHRRVIPTGSISRRDLASYEVNQEVLREANRLVANDMRDLSVATLHEDYGHPQPRTLAGIMRQLNLGDNVADCWACQVPERIEVINDDPHWLMRPLFMDIVELSTFVNPKDYQGYVFVIFKERSSNFHLCIRPRTPSPRRVPQEIVIPAVRPMTPPPPAQPSTWYFKYTCSMSLFTALLFIKFGRANFCLKRFSSQCGNALLCGCFCEFHSISWLFAITEELKGILTETQS